MTPGGMSAGYPVPKLCLWAVVSFLTWLPLGPCQDCHKGYRTQTQPPLSDIPWCSFSLCGGRAFLSVNPGDPKHQDFLNNSIPLGAQCVTIGRRKAFPFLGAQGQGKYGGATWRCVAALFGQVSAPPERGRKIGAARRLSKSVGIF